VIRWLEPGDVAAVGSVLGLARLFQGNGDYLVDWDGAEPRGHAHVAWTVPPELQDLEVRTEFRRRGVATSLIAAAETACWRRGAACLRVTVGAHNDGAAALYRSLGYADAGIPPYRVTGTVQLRTGPIEVDDVLVALEKRLVGS
jgi:ribosomal protein S18 acetylase RimI-like enzyme